MDEYNSVVVPILKWLNSLSNCKAINIHGGIFSQRGTPDIIGTFRGRTFTFECKIGAGIPSRQQKLRVRQWKNAGAVSHVVYSLEEVKEIFRKEMDYYE
jgi:penicillin-binding protein-related factor A (putative recombinase)